MVQPYFKTDQLVKRQANVGEDENPVKIETGFMG
jgi:hypothetical protein